MQINKFTLSLTWIVWHENRLVLMDEFNSSNGFERHGVDNSFWWSWSICVFVCMSIHVLHTGAMSIDPILITGQDKHVWHSVHPSSALFFFFSSFFLLLMLWRSSWTEQRRGLLNDYRDCRCHPEPTGTHESSGLAAGRDFFLGLCGIIQSINSGPCRILWEATAGRSLRQW